MGIYALLQERSVIHIRKFRPTFSDWETLVDIYLGTWNIVLRKDSSIALQTMKCDTPLPWNWLDSFCFIDIFVRKFQLGKSFSIFIDQPIKLSKNPRALLLVAEIPFHGFCSLSRIYSEMRHHEDASYRVLVIRETALKSENHWIWHWVA